MSNNLKRVFYIVALGILTLSLSSCSREDFPTELTAIDYQNVIYNKDTKILTGESGDETLVLDRNGQKIYSQSEYKKAGVVDGMTYYYHFDSNNRVKIMDESGLIIDEYANAPYGYELPDAEILLSDRKVVLTGKKWDYIYYDKYTGEILHELQADRCENFENGIAVVENAALSSNKNISSTELSMNGHSLNGYIQEDNFKFFLSETQGTFSNASDEKFAGTPFTANSFYEASYCQNGIIPYLVTISKNIVEDQTIYTPFYVFKDFTGNIISKQMFKKTSGFKNGVAFCEEYGKPNIHMMTLEGEYISTTLNVNEYSLNRVYYYPEFDCFGLTKSGKSEIPDVYITRSGDVIAQTPNKVKLFSEIMAYGRYVDYEHTLMILELVNNENESYSYLIYDNGVVISSPDECLVYVYNYETHTYKKYQTDEYTPHFYISKIDDRYASTSCGVIDMITSELVNTTPNAVAYDEKTDTVYIDKTMENADGSPTNIVLGYYKDSSTLIKFNCSECQYLGDGQFIIKKGNKYYTTVLF